ncbi:MAG: hypothetical protein PUP91_06705 [Rhizonema sp. PD37]|nr:hypothetical protein [Rhizonema sp. PD37]
MEMSRNNSLDIDHISPKVRELIEQYAVANNCTPTEMLERIILDWDAHQSGSERPSTEEDE